MQRSYRNKENIHVSKSKSISSYYKVQKRLFETNKFDFTSPISNSLQPSSPASEQDEESPYLYEIRKKAASKLEKISTPSCSTIDDTPLKSGGSAKQRICLSSNIMEISTDVIIQTGDDIVMESPKSSAILERLDKALDTEEEESLSGDFSQKCVLPVVKGKHPELLTISAETVAWLLVTDHNHEVVVIDCRYPYEFSAGHIKSAINFFSQKDVVETLFNSEVITEGTKSEKVLIFYCEFSSERAPNMMRHIRKQDRSMNEKDYPFVYYPEMYLVDGGYKSFFASFKELCEPQDYKPMLDKANTSDFIHYRILCKGLKL